MTIGEKIKKLRINKNKTQLDVAIKKAKENRTNLWNSNDKDGDGKVSPDIAKWIEDRYNEEVKVALERYK